MICDEPSRVDPIRDHVRALALRPWGRVAAGGTSSTGIGNGRAIATGAAATTARVAPAFGPHARAARAR